MAIAIGTYVTNPLYQPYPRFGRVIELLAEGKAKVSGVQCGDPRCAAEHQHGDVIWDAAGLEAGNAYQGRATWEDKRLSSPNAPVIDRRQAAMLAALPSGD